jgi:hypothetical protein
MLVAALILHSLIYLEKSKSIMEWLLKHKLRNAIAAIFILLGIPWIITLVIPTYRYALFNGEPYFEGALGMSFYSAIALSILCLIHFVSKKLPARTRAFFALDLRKLMVFALLFSFGIWRINSTYNLIPLLERYGLSTAPLFIALVALSYPASCALIIAYDKARARSQD